MDINELLKIAKTGFEIGSQAQSDKDTTDAHDDPDDTLAKALAGMLATLQYQDEELRVLRKRVDALEALVRDVRPDLEERLYDPRGVVVSRKAAESIRRQWSEKDRAERDRSNG